MGLVGYNVSDLIQDHYKEPVEGWFPEVTVIFPVQI